MVEKHHEIELASGSGWALPLLSEAHMDADAIAAIVAACGKRLGDTGVIGALSYLNARTRYRFTGLYHAQPPLLRNVQLFDRENPTLNVSGEVKPIHETYCGIVRDTNRALLITNALADVSVKAHPARESVLSYCGVPIRTEDGLPCGTLCHFDPRPRLLSRSESLILAAAAPLFMGWLTAQAA